jgi:hypothetical protein
MRVSTLSDHLISKRNHACAGIIADSSVLAELAAATDARMLWGVTALAQARDPPDDDGVRDTST